jgi:GntR family transcriptional repressor for pyruvate dehydrogenase complex
VNDARKDAIRRVLDVIHTDGMVTDGRLPTERGLSEMTGLSRVLLREALIAMEGMGIIDIRNRQGIYLNESNGDELSHHIESAPLWHPTERLANAMEMRMIIDPASASLAASRRSDGDLAEMNMCLDKLIEIHASGGDTEAESGAYWNSVLHGSIYDAARNVLLIRAHDSLKTFTEKGVASMRGRMPLIDAGWRGTILEEHKRIVEAIANADPGEAERQMHLHIGGTAKSMRMLGQFGDSPPYLGSEDNATTTSNLIKKALPSMKTKGGYMI